MPYGIPNETSAKTERMERCVNHILPKARANPKKYRVTEKHTAKQAAIAICKSSFGYTDEAQTRRKKVQSKALRKRLT